MINIEYYYNISSTRWIYCGKSFHNSQKALRFMFVLKNHPKMVFMAINGDDTYAIDWIRRKAGVDDVK